MTTKTRTTKRQNTYRRKHYIKRGPNEQQHNKSMLRYDRQLAWFSRL